MRCERIALPSELYPQGEIYYNIFFGICNCFFRFCRLKTDFSFSAGRTRRFLTRKRPSEPLKDTVGYPLSRHATTDATLTGSRRSSIFSYNQTAESIGGFFMV